MGAPNTSSYFMKNVGGKRESGPDRPLYIENVALGAMFSLSMLEDVQSIHEHYVLYGLSLERDPVTRFSARFFHQTTHGLLLIANDGVLQILLTN
jgi:hypothetical protein